LQAALASELDKHSQFLQCLVISANSKAAHHKLCRSTFNVDTVAKETAPAKRDPNVTDLAQQSLETGPIPLAFDIRPLIGMELDGHGEASRREDRGSGIRPEAAIGSVKVVVGAL
jgi:hypothetical protein